MHAADRNAHRPDRAAASALNRAAHQRERRCRSPGNAFLILDACLVSGSAASVDALEPVIDLALGLVLGHSVALLDATRELGALAFDDLHVVVGEVSPLLLNLAFELL